MAVKPGPGETLVTKTSIESNQSQDPDKLPPFWEYVESLSEGDWASGGYRFIVERGRKELKSEERSYIGDFFEKLTPADIAKRWGGGDYTIWFKVPPKGQQLKYKVGLKIDGAPLTATSGATSSYNGQPPSDPLTRLIDVMDRRLAQMEQKLEAATGSGAATAAVQQAVGLTGKVFEAATTAATSTLSNIAGAHHPAAGAPNPMQDLQTELMKAVIAKMLNPSDPIEAFGKMLAAVKALGFGGPAGSGNTVAQLAIEGIRVLPQAISEGVKGLEHWHLAEEARARQVAIMRGQNPIDVRPAPAAAPPAPPPVAGAPAPPPPVTANPPGAPTVQVNIETIEMGLVRILNNGAYTIEEAAHRAAALMEDLVPGMPDQVAAAGEAQILNLFQTRPILMAVPQNPRLTEFIKKFIEVVKSAPVVTQTQPAAHVPPA